MFWFIIILSSCIGITIGFLSFSVIESYIEKRSWIATTKEYVIGCPIEFERKFTKADLILAMKDSVDGGLQGRCFYPFNIPGLQCRLIIYPNGNKNEDYRGQTWIFLHVNASKERKIAAEFMFSVESANYLSKSVYSVYEDYFGYGATICKTDKFFDQKNKYFMDEEITVKVKGIMKAKRPLIPPSISNIPSPISLKWKIKEDDLREAMEPESNGRLQSKVLNIPSFYNVQYWLELRTKMFNDKNQAYACLLLNVAFGFGEKIEAFFDFSIDSVGYHQVFENVYHNGSEYCGRRFCLTEDLFDPSKRYIVDGYLTVNLNGIFIGKRYPFIFMNYDLVPRLPQQKAKDFMIVSGDKEIPVHKQLLMDVSPVWAGMIESGMKESIENKIVIEDFSFKAVAAAIKVFYNENGFCSLTVEEMFLLHKFAANYCIESLLDHVEQALVKIISALNVCQLIQLSAPDSCNVPKLHESCILFLGKCFTETTPVYGAETLGEKFLSSVFLRGLHPVSGIFMVKRNLRMTLKCKNGLPQIQGPKDFVIVIGDKEIPVHKQRLMDVSPVWVGMVGSGMKESIENKMVIEDFSFKIVAAATKLFYDQNGICGLTVEEIFSLYRFGDKYFIEFILDHVQRSLIKMISPSNVCQLVQLSAPESCNVSKLHESCIIFLGKCFKESTPVFGAECLGDKFFASIFLRGFHPVSDLVTHL